VLTFAFVLLLFIGALLFFLILTNRHIADAEFQINLIISPLDCRLQLIKLLILFLLVQIITNLLLNQSLDPVELIRGVKGFVGVHFFVIKFLGLLIELHSELLEVFLVLIQLGNPVIVRQVA
jgi:hypothetical protein